MTDRERAYHRKVEALIEGVGKLTEAEVERVRELLRESQQTVAARVATTEWQAHYLPQLKEAVKTTMQVFEQRYAADLATAQANLWAAGIDLVDWPLAYVGLRATLPEISISALEVMHGYSADLIVGLAEDAIKRINQELTLGILGQQTPFEVMMGIGRNLDDPSVYRTIAVRAETIARTELGRVNSAAREARIEQTVEANPDLPWQKKWLASGKAHPRPHHAALHQRMVPVDQNFPGGIPYPHAPGLSAAEVISCGCVHVLTLADWESLPDQYEAQPYQARAIWD